MDNQFTSEYFKLPNSVQNVVRLIATRAMPSAIILFGSRARGTQRINSDFDLCVLGRQSSVEEWNRLLLLIEDEPISLHSIDILTFEDIDENYRKARNCQKLI